MAPRLERVRPLHFPEAVYWFQATFVGDQKEQEILPVALDLHYGREVRHLDRLLDRTHLVEHPSLPLPEAAHVSVASAYPVARDHVVRSLSALANVRSREVHDYCERQIERMTAYYAQMRSELAEQVERARNRSEDLSRFASRFEALEREERLRVAELRQKSALRIQLRLLGVLVIHQPKLLVRATAVGERHSAPLELVWDPLVEMVEAVPCPVCGRPTFAFDLTRQGQLTCPACAAVVPVRGKQPR
jgi:hypothetical protein